jgi:beta-barrel assembly-enhancing protease
MISSRLVALGVLPALMLAGGDGPAPERPRGHGGPRVKAPAKAGRRAQPADETPPCISRVARASRRPPARSMPELFSRMGESFAIDPARGFQTFLGELEQLEGPALQDITLSRQEERRAGGAARQEFLQRAAARGHRVVNDPRPVNYLRALVAGFARRMRHRDRYPDLDVTLIEAREADGQSFPGGFLVFTTGLLDEPDEATVAGVVAHELAHLDRGHLYDYARRGKLAEATYSRPPGAGDSFDQFMTRQMALFGLLMNPFRPEHESEADCTSVTWLYQEGYDPRALVDFFERLHRRLNDPPDPPFFAFGRTHPFSLQRRRDCLDRLAQLQRWRPRADLGRFPDNLRRRVTRFEEH